VRGDLRGAGLPMPVWQPATEEDWSTEYLDAIISVKDVDGADAAIATIQKYGSQHTDCIVAEDRDAAERFHRPPRQRHRAAQCVDAVRRRRRVRHGRRDRHRHRPAARSRPVGVEQLTTFKVRGAGDGQVRPG
jgi:glutamate-5-semialdehyde dehydrogenase